MDKKVTFRNGRYYIKDTKIRLDLLVGLGVEQVKENYPWLPERQIMDALSFAKQVITEKGKHEATTHQIQAA